MGNNGEFTQPQQAVFGLGGFEGLRPEDIEVPAVKPLEQELPQASVMSDVPDPTKEWARDTAALVDAAPIAEVPTTTEQTSGYRPFAAQDKAREVMGATERPVNPPASASQETQTSGSNDVDDTSQLQSSGTGREVALRDKAQSPARPGMSLELSPTKLWASHREKREDKAEAKKAAQIQRWAREDDELTAQFAEDEPGLVNQIAHYLKIDPETYLDAPQQINPLELVSDVQAEAVRLLRNRLHPIIRNHSLGSFFAEVTSGVAGAIIVRDGQELQRSYEDEEMSLSMQDETERHPRDTVHQFNRELFEIYDDAPPEGVKGAVLPMSDREATESSIDAVTRGEVQAWQYPDTGTMYVRDGIKFVRTIDKARIGLFLASGRRAEAEQVYGGPISDEEAAKFKVNPNLKALQISRLTKVDRLGSKVLNWELLVVTAPEQTDDPDPKAQRRNQYRFVTAVRPDTNQTAGDDAKLLLDASSVLIAPNIRDGLSNYLTGQGDAVSQDWQMAPGTIITSTDSLERLSRELISPTAVGTVEEEITPGGKRRRVAALAIEHSITSAAAPSLNERETVDAELVDEPDLWGQPNGHPV